MTALKNERGLLENAFHYFVSWVCEGQESGWVRIKSVTSTRLGLCYETKGNAYFILEEEFNKIIGV